MRFRAEDSVLKRTIAQSSLSSRSRTPARSGSSKQIKVHLLLLVFLFNACAVITQVLCSCARCTARGCPEAPVVQQGLRRRRPLLCKAEPVADGHSRLENLLRLLHLLPGTSARTILTSASC